MVVVTERIMSRIFGYKSGGAISTMYNKALEASGLNLSDN